MKDKKGALKSNGVLATGIGFVYALLNMNGISVADQIGITQAELVDAIAILATFLWGLWGRVRATTKIEGFW